MTKNIIQGIIFILIIVGLPILANLIVNILENIVTMQMIMKCVYSALGLSTIYLLKEAR